MAAAEGRQESCMHGCDVRAIVRVVVLQDDGVVHAMQMRRSLSVTFVTVVRLELPHAHRLKKAPIARLYATSRFV